MCIYIAKYKKEAYDNRPIVNTYSEQDSEIDLERKRKKRKGEMTWDRWYNKNNREKQRYLEHVMLVVV